MRPPAQGGPQAAVPIKVLSSNGVRAALCELGPQFEHATRHRLAIRFDVAQLLKAQILGGEAFDVAILTEPATDELLKAGRIVAGTRRDIARSGIGVAIRAGAPKPDIGTVEAFKRVLLGAESVANTTQGASGIYFAGVLERLGIAEQMKPKSRVQAGGLVAEMVARGLAELAVQQISELLPVAGVELVGPFPPELQNFTVFSAGVGTDTGDSEAAYALIRFLTGPAAAPIIKAKGMEPAD